MWDFWRYAARCRGVKVAVMESVQQTFIQGRTLMQQLHAELERLTGKKWNLTHVLHSCAQCGGASVRKRYFMVCSTEDIDFQIEEPDVVRVPSVWDTIGDLETCEVTAEEQDINPATMLISRYISRARRRDNRVDGHLISNSACARRASTLAQAVKWKNGENIEMTIGQAMDEDKEVLLRGIGFDTYALARALLYGGDSGGASRFSCFRMNQFDVAPTLTGGALQLFVHPTLPRTLTHREVARIQGFTDDWSCQPAIDAGQKGHLWWGKGVTVQAGEWICKEVAMCLKGRNMGNMAHKEQVGEREFIVDVTGKYLLPTTHGKD
jgi:site-specific DNA-cytosine methylase